jgi:hypothetical protein
VQFRWLEPCGSTANNRPEFSLAASRKCREEHFRPFELELDLAAEQPLSPLRGLIGGIVATWDSRPRLQYAATSRLCSPLDALPDCRFANGARVFCQS